MLWPELPGLNYTRDFVNTAIVGMNNGYSPGVGVAKAWPFILPRPGRVVSVGVRSHNTASISPGDTWEFAFFTPDGKNKFGTVTLVGAGLTAWSTNEASIQLDVPDKFILVAMCTVSNGGTYYANTNSSGANLPGWPGGQYPPSTQYRFPLQSDSIPATLDNFSFGTMLSVSAEQKNIRPFVAVER